MDNNNWKTVGFVLLGILIVGLGGWGVVHFLKKPTTSTTVITKSTASSFNNAPLGPVSSTGSTTQLSTLPPPPTKTVAVKS